MDSGRLIAIGDVHGCAHALDAILDCIGPAPDDHLVFLGDLIDQGRDTRDVLDRVLGLRRQCRITLIRGNHEEMLYAAHESEKALRYWEACGGLAMLRSYFYGAKLSDIPDAHWKLLDQCQDYLETDDYIFAHANYLPDEPMAAQPDFQLRWALLDPEEAAPHVSGKTVVVGHTEQPNSEVLDLGFALCLDTACWRHGWLTAMELPSKRLWQASRWGILRQADEQPDRGRVPLFARSA
ncbi:MAG: serine/threonine protein phosphatase [Planctomycetota bacterium]|nr:MAG: serine/threonine protein phosphatase [Planctomycetota bacterium]